MVNNIIKHSPNWWVTNGLLKIISLDCIGPKFSLTLGQLTWKFIRNLNFKSSCFGLYFTFSLLFILLFFCIETRTPCCDTCFAFAWFITSFTWRNRSWWIIFLWRGHFLNLTKFNFLMINLGSNAFLKCLIIKIWPIVKLRNLVS